MALLADGTADVGSNLVSGAGTQAATYKMPDGVRQDVESVVATIKNASANDVAPGLVIRDASGQVIATGETDDVIPAGQTGTATFALGLARARADGVRLNRNNVGRFFELTLNGQGINPQTVLWTITGGGVDWFITDPTFGEFLVSAPFFHFFTPLADFRMLADGECTWTGESLSASFASGFDFSDGAAEVIADGAGNLLMVVGAGNTFTVTDHNGVPKLRWTEGTVNLHIPTGGVVVADL